MNSNLGEPRVFTGEEALLFLNFKAAFVRSEEAPQASETRLQAACDAANYAERLGLWPFELRAMSVWMPAFEIAKQMLQSPPFDPKTDAEAARLLREHGQEAAARLAVQTSDLGVVYRRAFEQRRAFLESWNHGFLLASGQH